MNTQTFASAALLLTAALTLTGCGGEGSGMNGGSAQPAQEFNEADVTFAQEMIPHHVQAIEMAQLAEDRGESDEVKQLAVDVGAAQGPEIEQLTAWLEEWDADGPSESGDHDGHGDMGDDDTGGDTDDSSEVSGMMSEDDMAMLEDASGAEFDQMFLEMMIDHHRGAVSMAEIEVDEGEHADAIAMAKRIVTTQEDEIRQMEQLLSS